MCCTHFYCANRRSIPAITELGASHKRKLRLKKTILEIYALAVCFFAVACFVIVLGMTLWSIAKYSSPEFTMMSYTCEIYESDESYKEHLVDTKKHRDENYEPPVGEALTQKRKEAWSQIIRSEKHDSLLEIVQYSITLLVDFLVFVAHWVLAKRSRESHS